MNYWQVAAGDVGRDYSDAFIRYGIAFVGGDPCVEAMKWVKDGDCIVLKRGTGQILAVGTVAARNGCVNGAYDKEWLRDFDGWDLPAYCYVDWHVPDAPIAVSGLARGTILGLKQEHLIAKAHEILVSLPLRRPLATEPEATEALEDDVILNFLIKEGLRPSAAEDLTDAFRRIRLLASYYYRHASWEDIREHETRTFLVMPLLLALGWAEQQMKIELPCPGGKIDVACFSRPYRRSAESAWQPNNSDCALIIETNGFTQGLSYAPGQAHEYAKAFASARVALVTNGYCYKTFARSADGSFSLTPTAYLNILRPQKRYPLDPEHVDGGLEVLRQLLPISVR